MDDNQKKTLMKWRARCKRAQIAHSHSAMMYDRINTGIGVLLILLTVSTSVFTFAQFSESIRWIPIVVSISATIFATFQTFFRFSEKAEIHRNVAGRFGALKKELEFIVDFRTGEERRRHKKAR